MSNGAMLNRLPKSRHFFQPSFVARLTAGRTFGLVCPLLNDKMISK